MDTKPFARPKPPPPSYPLLSALFLYSEQDTEYLDKLKYFLNLSQQDKNLSVVRYFYLEKFQRRRFLDNLQRSDICFCLFSDYFRSLIGGYPEVEQKLMDEHQLKRVRVVTFLLNNSQIELTPFRSSFILPGISHPIQGELWKHEEDAMRQAYRTLGPICLQLRRYKDNVQRSWDNIKNSKDEALFEGFLEIFPHCRYAAEARKQLDELREDRLWQAAIENDDAVSYYDYLQLAPLRYHFQDAASRLNAIEENEELIWNDVREKARPEFYLKYKAYFPNGKYNEFIDNELKRQLRKPISLAKKDKPESFEGFFLKKKAYEALQGKPEEVFSMESYLDYCKSIRNQLSRLYRKLSRKVVEYGAYIAMLVLVELFFLWIQPDLEAWLNRNAFVFLLALGINIWFFYRAYQGYYHISQDLDTVKGNGELLKRASVLIKASFITGDKKSVKQVLEVMRDIEDHQKEVDKKGFLYYLTISPLEKREESPQQI